MIKKIKTIIIAEAGVNHNGNIESAKKMVIAAASTGVDFIKFQKFSSENLVTHYAKKPRYAETKKKTSQLKMLRNLELSDSNFIQLKKLCNQKKIGFLVSGFDIESLNFLKKIKLNIFKIPSGEINNIPYLRHVGGFNKKIILSTGMSNINEINLALNTLLSSGTKKKNISLLHCNTDYPTSFRDVNLNTIKELKKKFKVNVGFSDHTLGIEASLAAVALGARVIEKHFTLNKNAAGPDHKASLELKELENLVKSIRNIENAFGNKNKQVTKSEKKNIKFVRKSIVAKKNIAKGEVFSNINITTKRPATGKSPTLWDTILGKKAKKKYQKDQLI